MIGTLCFVLRYNTRFNALSNKKKTNILYWIVVLYTDCSIYLFLFQEFSTLFKVLVSTLQEDCAPLLNDMVHLTVEVYRQCPQQHILTVAKTVIQKKNDYDMDLF